MRVVVLGATGNIGTAVVRELSSRGHEVVGVARRTPDGPAIGSVQWRAADVGSDDLDPVVAGADAVVHLAWMFQPTRQPAVTWQANAVGTRRVLDAVARQGVPAVVVSSSVAAYSPAADDEPVDESWPTDGPSTAAYAREKAYVERSMDALVAEHPEVRAVRLRPAFVFQRSAGSEQRRIFAAPLVRPAFFDRRLIPVLPIPRGLRMQAVHSADLAHAFAEAVERPVTGAFNIAADGVLHGDDLGRILDARTVTVPRRPVRAAVEAAWRSGLIGAPGDLFDAFMDIPVMSTQRARRELGWQPRHGAAEALQAMMDGARENRGSRMPPLDPDR